MTRVPGLGRGVVHNLLDVIDDPLELFQSPESIRQHSVRGIGPSRGETLIDRLHRWDPEESASRLEEQRIGLLSIRDESYPDSLRSIHEPPVVLFYRGNPDLLEPCRVAIVGTRRASEEGKEIARDLARGLTRRNVVVVSGLAAGIDSAAHRGALDGEATTVAVLGNGLQQVYPARNRDLQNRMADEALVLSEYPPDQDPSRHTFPERNRIISGLSSAVLVVQAGERSGSLITADFALEQGRDVYAVPGNVNSNLHDGCHLLLKQGAGLVEEVEDLIDYLQLSGHYVPTERSVELDPESARLLEHLAEKPRHVDELVMESQLDLATVSRCLMELEDANLVLPAPGQRYQRSRDAQHARISVREPDPSEGTEEMNPD